MLKDKMTIDGIGRYVIHLLQIHGDPKRKVRVDSTMRIKDCRMTAPQNSREADFNEEILKLEKAGYVKKISLATVKQFK